MELKINYLLFPAIRASPRIVQLRCAYEAYLAQEEGKTILIAHSSHFPQILAALRWIVLAAFVGAALGLASTLRGVGGPYGGAVLALSLMAFSLVIQDETFRRLMHLVGQMLCWIEVTHRAGWVFKAEAGLKAAFKHGSSTSFIKLLCSEVSPLQNKTWTFDVQYYNIYIYYIILYACISVFCAIIPVCPLIYIIIYNIFSHVARHILTYYILKYMLPRSATYSENLLQCFLTFFGNFSCDVF